MFSFDEWVPKRPRRVQKLPGCSLAPYVATETGVLPVASRANSAMGMPSTGKAVCAPLYDDSVNRPTLGERRFSSVGSLRS